jgi:biopolymer transport protein ExbD
VNSDVELDGTVTGINVTPLVDIMLVLLIIFMVTAHLTSEASVKINLPKAAVADASATASYTVTVDRKGDLRLMDDAVDLNGLKSSLAREAGRNPSVRVTLAADGSLPYRQVVSILDAIKSAGVTRVALAAEK